MLLQVTAPKINIIGKGLKTRARALIRRRKIGMFNNNEIIIFHQQDERQMVIVLKYTHNKQGCY
jgi:hypothetical protein